jgi:hypothetical protein
VKYFFALVTAVALLSGCASSPGSVKGTEGVSREARVTSTDVVQVKVERGATSMVDVDTARLAEVVKREVDAYGKKNPSNTTGQGRKLLVQVDMTTYEKGNAFARAMLAGLGQIKLAGNVRVVDSTSGQKLFEFVADKTFAWGGIYGASTRMEDVEPAFAEAIAQGLTGIEKKD